MERAVSYWFAAELLLAAASENDSVAGVSISAPLVLSTFAEELASWFVFVAAGTSAGTSAGVSSETLWRTEVSPLRAGIEIIRAEIMNIVAAAIVSFDKTEAVPRGPYAALETLLVNRAPASVLPG